VRARGEYNCRGFNAFQRSTDMVLKRRHGDNVHNSCRWKCHSEKVADGSQRSSILEINKSFAATLDKLRVTLKSHYDRLSPSPAYSGCTSGPVRRQFPMQIFHTHTYAVGVVIYTSGGIGVLKTITDII